MGGKGETELRTDVTCPFCGLACDDLVVDAGGENLRVTKNGCPRGIDAFARPAGNAGPTADGKPVTPDEAVARAAGILAAARFPVFAGLGTDVAGVRAVMDMADRTGGVVDHMGSAPLFRNLRTVQDDGWLATTLSEVRNRVDLLVVIGPGVPTLFPRFFERCIWPGDTLFGGVVKDRQVVFIGPGPDDIAAAMASAVKKAKQPVSIPCETEDLPAVAGALRALLNGRPVNEDTIGGAPVAALDDLAQRMKAAGYGVITWAAASFNEQGGDLTVAVISDMLRDLNKSGRFNGLPLAGMDNGIGANQVCTWQSGFPLRTSFARGYPEHDAYHFDAARLVDSGEADALVWISSFRDDPIPYARDLPTIALGLPGTRFNREPEVFIPVATPGLDHAGQIFRTDGVVALPVHGLRDTDLPSVADAIARIGDALAATRKRGGANA